MIRGVLTAAQDVAFALDEIVKNPESGDPARHQARELLLGLTPAVEQVATAVLALRPPLQPLQLQRACGMESLLVAARQRLKPEEGAPPLPELPPLSLAPEHLLTLCSEAVQWAHLCSTAEDVILRRQIEQGTPSDSAAIDPDAASDSIREPARTAPESRVAQANKDCSQNSRSRRQGKNGLSAVGKGSSGSDESTPQLASGAAGVHCVSDGFSRLSVCTAAAESGSASCGCGAGECVRHRTLAFEQLERSSHALLKTALDLAAVVPPSRVEGRIAAAVVRLPALALVLAELSSTSTTGAVEALYRSLLGSPLLRAAALALADMPAMLPAEMLIGLAGQAPREEAGEQQPGTSSWSAAGRMSADAAAGVSTSGGSDQLGGSSPSARGSQNQRERHPLAGAALRAPGSFREASSLPQPSRLDMAVISVCGKLLPALEAVHMCAVPGGWSSSLQNGSSGSGRNVDDGEELHVLLAQLQVPHWRPHADIKTSPVADLGALD